jgi:hypothetical protein
MPSAPEVPQFDKGKFSQLPLLERFWEMLRPFFAHTSSVLKMGVLHGVAGDGYQPGNLLAFYREVQVPAGSPFPLIVRNHLPGPAKGVVVWAVRWEASPDIAVIDGYGPGAGIFLDWQNAIEGGFSVVRIRGITGLSSTSSYVLTLAVYGG